MRILWIIAIVTAGWIGFGVVTKWLTFRSMKRWIFMEAFLADEYFWDEKDFCRKVAYNLNLSVDDAQSAFKMAATTETGKCVIIAKVMLSVFQIGVEAPWRTISADSFQKQMLKLGIEEAKVRASILWDSKALSELKRPPLAEPPKDFNWVSCGF